MLPIKFLVALMALYDGVLYVHRPLHCTSANITYYGDVTSNTIWHKLNSASLGDLPVFKISTTNFTSVDVLTFKVKYVFPDYSIATNWQTILLKNMKFAPYDKGCCVSAIIFGILLLALTLLCISTFGVYYYSAT